MSTSIYTMRCAVCGTRVPNGQPCPNCSNTRVTMPSYDDYQTKYIPTKKVLPIETIITGLAGILFIAVICFALIITLGKNTPLGQRAMSLFGIDVPSVFAQAPTAVPFSELKPEDLPAITTYLVENCTVTGDDAQKVTCFKTEMHQVDENWLTQFQADDGSFIQEQFPSFNGLEFLLVCFPEQLSSTWAKTYGEQFFTAIGTRPINPETGQEDIDTIGAGYWLFANPEKFQASVNQAANSTTNVSSLVPTPFPTETLAPTLLPPTPTPAVINVSSTFNEIDFEDLAYNRNAGQLVWERCDGMSLTFRQSNDFGMIEAACPSFDNPTVLVEKVVGLGGLYTMYWSDGGGSWFTQGGVMNLGNIGAPQYSWTNSFGIKLYSVGFGKVTLSPVQLFAPTATPPPTPLPEITPTPTSWIPEVGCINLTWDQLTSNAQAIVNEMGDSVLVHQQDGTWDGNNNSSRCYTITGLPTTVISLDDGRTGTWNQSIINLAWLDDAYQTNNFVWRISNYVWVGMVDVNP